MKQKIDTHSNEKPFEIGVYVCHTSFCLTRPVFHFTRCFPKTIAITTLNQHLLTVIAGGKQNCRDHNYSDKGEEIRISQKKNLNIVDERESGLLQYLE